MYLLTYNLIICNLHFTFYVSTYLPIYSKFVKSMSNIDYKGVAHVSFVGYDFYQ